MSDTSKFIKNFIEEKINTHNTEKTYFNEQLLILDESKGKYTESTYKIDSSYFPQIQDVNNKIVDVKNAYDARISSGCKTDLFWRLIETRTLVGSDFPPTTRIEYVYKCEQASPTGFGTDSITYITSGINTATTPNNLLGLEPDNLYGIRIYDEPYSVDVIDSYVGSFIGTIGVGSTILTVMSPKITTQVSESLSIGQIIIDNDSNVFALGQTNEIVGLGTTSVSLNLVSETYPTNPVVVDQLILKYPASREVNAPEPDGSFVSFTVLKDPDLIQDYGLPFASNPYVPQTIKMMDNNTLGKGTQIEFDNASGYSNAPTSWNKFMEGLPDPAYIEDYDPENVVRKPQVGAGKVYYRIGFDYRPLKNGSPASVGDIGVNSLFSFECTTGSLPTCSAEIENAIINAIEIRNAAEQNLTNSNSEILEKIKLSNMIRDELSEIDIRIWGYRCHIGKSSENLDLYNGRMNELNSNTFSNLI